MTIIVHEIGDDLPVVEPGGTGCLRTDRGNLPLRRLDVRAAVTGLIARTDLVQGFHNPHDVPLEATYVFPLPDRAAVTAMTLTAANRTVVAELHERARARQAYDEAIAQGRRAAIAEEDRPDVFTMRVGNIAPGESVEVALTMVGPLPFEDGEATFRFPLVVAPRYIPGSPISGEPAGPGYAADTDRTPDASRITPPVLLPGFPNPVDLSIEVHIDPAGLPLPEVRSSLHTIITGDGMIRIQPGERVNRDFMLRLRYGTEQLATALSVCADPDGTEGTFQLSVIPPSPTANGRGKDVVLVLDRSGSMHGWKIVAARRAAARIIDALGGADRFAVLTFDTVIERPDGLPAGLVAATDRNRYRAVEHLARADARGGTELHEPLVRGLQMLRAGEAGRDRVLVLVTDGQVGNEDDILHGISPLVHDVRVHTVGIDQAVNAGFLGRLAAAGGGRCELVESEDRLDEAMDAIHRRITAALITGIRLAGDGVIDTTVSPRRLPGMFSGVPLVVRGRFRDTTPTLTLTGVAADGSDWTVSAQPTPTTDGALRQVWARAIIRDLEDADASDPSDELEQRIIDTSLRFGVLSRFTSFLAVDSRTDNTTGELHRIVQPVELVAGWAPPGPTPAMTHAAASAAVPLAFAATTSAAGRTATASSGGLHRARALASSTGRVADRDADLAELRNLAATEARRLEHRPTSEREMRDVLDDLATRLAAMLRHLRVLSGDTTRLAAILKLLRDRSRTATERWDRTKHALRELAAPPS
jgi:Ca-activated chloride channel family protein